MTTVKAAKPFENTSIAIFMRHRLDEISSYKSQREVAVEAGYDKPNIISMFKRGETKIPFDKVPVLARALDTDPVEFLRLHLEQPGGWEPKVVSEMFGRMVTTNMLKIVEIVREEAGTIDPKLSAAQLQVIREGIQKALASERRRAAV